ncbi:LOW QUALITY PROTEIN: retrovirus-related Pol polyprotein from transposon [Elysia marginata]|uniref:Retrovirus-related Pol polyprotein from transposon n=1 Tax=Elysia marginata TaxID=1093978 RepID=A0AAV4HF12_9GAST|nr:LOW QUALITY PROTEIN: retrovirus-related Pol polyprotein from transposon [Elysia marginata]
MPFGLTNAPATFARAINLVLRGLTWKHVLAFLDDILVMGRDFTLHLRNLADVLSRFKKFGLKLKPRKCELFQKKDWPSVAEFARIKASPPSRAPCQLVGGVAVFCDPATWPKTRDLGRLASGPRRVAVGIHPSRADAMTSEDWVRFESILGSPRVRALGVGLDFFREPCQRSVQHRTLRQTLAFASCRKPVVLHLRGSPSDELATEPHRLALAEAKKFCGRQQPFHIHCCSFGFAQMSEWMREFPNTCFGYTGRSLNSEQVSGLRSLWLTEPNRLLLETDAPYLRSGVDNSGCNLPSCLGQVATYIGGVLRVKPARLLQETLKNGERFYSPEVLR